LRPVVVRVCAVNLGVEWAVFMSVGVRFRVCVVCVCVLYGVCNPNGCGFRLLAHVCECF
jgi:hypothetical protein